ncbi:MULTISPECIES: hypothetical protein [unclassified Duganella]|uniref:hypothetical protein n=1 Tax=unclassified Duganella TaxID=2636909 RepID=UPI00088528AF|nr:MULTISPECIES: hypothetical protein [unclassified Duganella]SDH59802.1 N-terminal double-transmembrane domain-containing protein [Duganella sp. OV458]SDJ43395.1 N-terminal double-transmembrane domain-containing protein [Duganella sp. OV510]
MMLSSYPLWWLALPVLLLPVWWHRQKRQRLKAESLATARFLPSAPPEQLRVWQWRDKVLLMVRCLMLVALIGWLAATIFPWRGDTVLIDAGVDKAWAEQQIATAGFSAATRMPLPPGALTWLRQNERDWRADAKLLIVARDSQVAMPARVPQFSHQLALRTSPAPTASLPATAGTTTTADAGASSPLVLQHVVLAAAESRAQAWRSLFAAFDTAGGRASLYTLASEPGAATTLIVWDTPNSTPPVTWRAAHWWIAAPTAVFPELAHASTLAINGITLKYADSPRGRLWTSDAFPPRDADTAHALYEAWQLLAVNPAPAYATPSQTFAETRSALPAISEARPATWLAILLLALFMLERILTHARRN